MKQLFFKFWLLCNLAITLFSCNKSENENLTQTPEKSSITTVGLIKKCNDCGNSSSKTYFYCGINAGASYIDNNNVSLSLINESIFKNIPVRVYFDENIPDRILSVESISESDKKEWEGYIKKEVFPSESIEDLNKSVPTNKALSMTFTWTETVNFFNAMKNSGCLPTNYANGCIPFQFANDGCYARAHAMRRYLNSIGKDCYKYFAYGNLWVNTATSPSVCSVRWRYHVAPMVYTNSNWYIVDPSLFTTPVLYTTWLNKMKFNGGTVTTTRRTNSSVYYYDYISSSSTYDNSYINTNSTLVDYRYRTTTCM